MGIRERRERQRRQLKDAILSAAREVARTEGWRAVTIRKIAGLIEYSPPVVYEYFDSKEDLLLELVRMGYAEQLEAVRSARESSESPAGALHRMARAWVAFAMKSPDLYQAMYGLGGVSFPAAELEKEGVKIAEAIGEAVRDVLRESGKDTDDVPEKVVLLWGTAHGLVALAMAGRIPEGTDGATRLLERATRDLLTAWTEA